MSARYQVGQKIRIKPADTQQLSPRDSDIELYAGQIGEVTDYYWMSPRVSEIFYIYTIRVESHNKEIVLHEDEIEPHIG